MTVAVLALAALLAGCATPASRIRRNQALFDSFPPDVQAQIRAGEIAVGFTEEMVVLALGRPHHVYTRRTRSGVTRIWAYVGFYPAARAPRWAGRYSFYRDRRGRPILVSDQRSPLTLLPDEQYERLRVEFRDGTVTAIEALEL